MEIEESRRIASEWIAAETVYADSKYRDRTEEDDDMLEHGMNEEWLWFTELANRLSRVKTLGVNTPIGRQAMGKLVVTTLSAFESMIRMCGSPPEAGHTSGEIVESGIRLR